MVDVLDTVLSDDPKALSKAEPAPPSSVVIFGAAGDLTKRLLMPALYNLSVAGLLDDKFQVRGVDRAAGDDASFRTSQKVAMESFVHDRGGEFSPASLDQTKLDWLCDRLTYQSGDFADPATFKAIGEWIDGRCTVFYLAVADRFFGPIIERLAEAGLLQERDGVFRRVVIEKPFGHDLPSARALNMRILKVLDEKQIFRIDHFLGKETVQNIMALRFSNGIFEPIWGREHIDYVEITAAETIGVEKRAKFYEPTGALRDMVPNHMFQLLSMVAMEPPNSFDADAVRTEKAKVIDAMHPLNSDQLLDSVVRGQYGAGHMHGEDVAAYRAEPDVDPASTTETYIALRFTIDNWRWAGVPFYIRTGKRMTFRKTEIVVHFKQAPYALFRDTPVHRLTPNVMTLHIQPTEGVSLQFSAKIPGPVVRLGGVTMDMKYTDYFKIGSATGYETLLYDVLIGDATLFQRADNIEAGWCAVQPVLDAIAEGTLPPERYEAGGAGPAEAEAMLAREGHRWARLVS
jgi:glucose-6-phosphate 1-dehydrogenase